MSDNENFEEPLDFLLKPELIKEFITMLQNRIAAAEANMSQLDETKAKIENTTNTLKSKLETLEKYTQFIEAKGFGYTKQTADEYFKKMNEAQTNRLLENNSSYSHCGRNYVIDEMVYVCFRPENHEGECGS